MTIPPWGSLAVVSFFGPLPEPPPVPSIPPQPRWVAPAHDVLPASLAVDLLLAVGPSAALWLSRMAVIGNGLELTLSATLTEPRPGAEDLMHGPGQPGGEDACRAGPQRVREGIRRRAWRLGPRRRQRAGSCRGVDVAGAAPVRAQRQSTDREQAGAALVDVDGAHQPHPAASGWRRRM